MTSEAFVEPAPTPLALLLLGRDAGPDENRAKEVVPLGPIGDGRLGLRPGRKGEVGKPSPRSAKKKSTKSSLAFLDCSLFSVVFSMSF